MNSIKNDGMPNKYEFPANNKSKATINFIICNLESLQNINQMEKKNMKHRSRSLWECELRIDGKCKYVFSFTIVPLRNHTKKSTNIDM